MLDPPSAIHVVITGPGRGSQREGTLLETARVQGFVTVSPLRGQPADT